MVSGIKTNEAVNAVYKELKNDRKIKAMILKINDQTELEVEQSWKTEEFKHEDFTSKLPADDCRFAIVDFEYETSEGRKDFKILFILWAPISCKPQKKMKYSTSVNGIVDELGAIGLLVQADSASDVTREALTGKLHDKFK